MSFRDSVKDNTKSVMIQTFITSLFSDPHMRFGDILEDLIETDDPDDDWMRETLYDLEIGQLVKAGMKIMNLGSEGNGLDKDDAFGLDADGDGVVTTETEDGTEYSLDGADSDGDDVGPAEPPRKKKKKKKKKKPKNAAEAAPKKKKKKKKKPQSVPAKRSKDAEEAEVDPEWKGYLKLIVKGLRAHKAYDEETAVNNGAILNHIHGEDEWDKVESADLRRGIEDLVRTDNVSKVGQRRGTRYHLN